MTSKMTTKTLFSAPKARLLAATLGVFITSTIVTAALPAYLPFEQGDRIAGPILMFPFTWAALLFYSLISPSIRRVWTVLTGIALSHALIIYFALQTGS